MKYFYFDPITIFLGGILTVVIAYFLLSKKNIFPNLFSIISFILNKKPNLASVVTGKTIVQEIRNIAQLFTQSFYDECVITYIKNNNKDKLVLIAKGKVIAGFDLSILEEDNFEIYKKNIIITLPPPKILEVIVNPTGYDFFVEEGYFNHDDNIKAKKMAEKQLENNSIKKDILKKSEEYGKKLIENFFTFLGFEKVEVIIGKTNEENFLIKQ